jgi:hypothetical protein
MARKHDLLGSKENPPLGFIPLAKPSVGGGKGWGLGWVGLGT